MFKLLALAIISLLVNGSAIAAELYKCETISRAFFLDDDMYESIEKPDFIFSVNDNDALVGPWNAIVTFSEAKGLGFAGEYKVARIVFDENGFFSQNLNHFIRFQSDHLMLVDRNDTVLKAKCQKI